jgi:hypothetical protein
LLIVAWPSSGKDHLDHDGENDDDDLGRPVQRGPVQGKQQDDGGDDEVDALDLEADLGRPVEQRDQPVPVLHRTARG